MALEQIVNALRQDDWHRELQRSSAALQRGRALQISELPTAAQTAVIAGLISALDLPVLLLTGRLDTAEQLTADLSQYLTEERSPIIWPSPETLPYEQLPLERSASARRVEILARLRQGGPAVVVASARGLAQHLTSPKELLGEMLALRSGQRIRPDTIVTTLINQGYDLVSIVSGPGQMSRRGGIVDVFPPSQEYALRIDFFGDEIDSLRFFDPESQRSVSIIQEFAILPPFEVDLSEREQAIRDLETVDTSGLRPEVADEWERTLRRLGHGDPSVALDLFSPYLLKNRASLVDYLPEKHLVIAIEPASIQLSIGQLENQAEELRETLESAGELPVGLRRPYLSWSEIQTRLVETRQVAFGSIPSGWQPNLATQLSDSTGFEVRSTIYAGRMDAVVEDIRQWVDDDWSVVLATEQSERTAELLEEHDIFPQVRTARPVGPRGRAIDTFVPTPGTVEVVHSRLSGGWQHPGLRLVVLTDRELFGYRAAPQQPPRRRATTSPALIQQLSEGQYVVHIEHGIARYGGIVRLEVSEVEREYLLLEYAERDRLYLPVDQIDRITPYEGGGIEPRLTRLGSPEWNRVKQRVRRAVREMAYELLQLYAARESAHTDPFPPDTTWDRELEESFPFNETPDQLRAIQEVKRDLESQTPMDRLVCGDVGYGKTEVALRAAFKAVNAGFQVAILVPTTVLALQHFHSFQARLSAFPVRIEMLSRLRSKKEQAQITAGLADGDIDIVIGTHRLLQNDVRFRRLGLLVIDEEQRFGVTHKEQLKRARTDVHVLTLTATPIPRTLHMALAGIRDLSVINTPPRDRTPIRTFVTPSSDMLIREAIVRELGRNGQVYFVHNRVQSIDHVLQRLRRLVPEARFGIGHGQMDENELEKVMLAFVEHEFDVLLCTTIIESGVDIANVNTVIIDRAHNLGLTQLYQLRGRVGRSHHRAYAYLLYDENRALSEEAVARLEAIQEATELGAGFQIALRDLEIRGAGNILGGEQSGHIAAVGFDLYTRMLAMAVEEVREGRPIEEPESVSIDLPIDAVIPEEYAGAEDVRIDLYRKLAAVRSLANLRDLQEELIDRFGPLPEPVQRLVELARLRIRASNLGITSIIEREGEVYVRPVVGARLNQDDLRRQLGSGVIVTPNQVRFNSGRLNIGVWDAVQSIIRAVEDSDATVLANVG